MPYYVNGRAVKLGRTLGEGGEAVIKMDDTPGSRLAYKLYKPDATITLTQLRQRKITEAIQRNLPDNVYGPIAPVTDQPKRGSIVGFQMRLFPDGYLNLEDLADKAVWDNFGLSQRRIVTIFLNLHNLLTRLHSLGVVVGDASSMNFQFHPSRLDVIACDVDSWQFGDDTPCVIGTMDYLAPRQYNKDLETGQHPFLPDDDWWGFAINLFRALTRLHPFREGKTGVPLTSDRVMMGLHVLNPALPYPPTRVALPLTSLPDRKLAFFRQVFEDRCIAAFPSDMLTWLQSQWIECPEHGHETVYAQGRPMCPHCAKDRSVPDLSQAPAAVITIEQVYRPAVERRVLFAKAVGRDVQQLCMICTDSTSQLRAVWLDVSGSARDVSLQAIFKPGQRYDVNPQHILIADGGSVRLFNAADGSLLHQLETQTYMHRPIAALATAPFWLIGASMVRGELFYGQMHHKSIMPMSYGNVWFTASAYGEKDIVVGFTNLLGKQRWFVHVDGLFHELPEVETQRDEFLMDWQVIFDESSFAIIRRIQNPQESTQVVADLFDKRHHRHREAMPADGLHGLPALRNSLLYPTEHGILRVSPGQGASVLPGTEAVFSTNLLVAVREGSVGHLYVIDETSSAVYRVTK